MTPLKITVTALALVVAVPLARPADEPPKRDARTLGGHTGTVRVLYAPDGTLATFSDDRTIQLRDGQGRIAHRLVGHDGLVITASFSPDSKTLATADGKAVRLWDVAKGEARTADGLPTGVERLTFSPDGKTLACVVGRGEIRLWDVASGKVTRSFSADHPKDVPVITSSVAYAPDGQTLAVAHPAVSSVATRQRQVAQLMRCPNLFASERSRAAYPISSPALVGSRKRSVHPSPRS